MSRARYARVQAAMARHGVGALLLATPHLAAFASGARRVRVAGSGGVVPWVVVAAGAPAATVFTTDPDGAPPWMPRAQVEPLRWNRDRQLERIAALVADTRGAVACDVFSPEVRDLVAASGRPLVDAAALLADAAAPRTAAEVEEIARALGAARAAVRAAAAAVRPGVGVAALAAHAAETMPAAGAGFPLGEGRAWRLDPGPQRLGPGATVAAGDVLALEVGLYVGAHAGVAGDTVAADGRARAVERRAWSSALCALAGHCRVGGTTADLRAAARAAGILETGLLAHGLGIGVEPPLVACDASDATPLRAGTVLVLAPAVPGYRATRALVVTEAAPRWLEPAP
jgi:Xaa-Pro aminopeptidase